MIGTLIKHDILRSIRSARLNGSLFFKILMIFSYLYFGGIAAVLGWAFHKGIEKGADDLAEYGTPLFLLFTAFFYFMLLGMYMRTAFQDESGVRLKNYITHPVSKKSLVTVIFSGLYWQGILFVALCFLVPLFFTYLVPVHGIASGFVVVSIAVCMSIIATCGSFLMKQIVGSKMLLSFGFPLLIIGLGFLDYKTNFFISRPISNVLEYMTLNIWPAIIFLLLTAALVFYVFKYMSARLYLDTAKDEVSEGGSALYESIDSIFSLNSSWALFMKLMLRNKRPRMQIIMGTLFLFFGFFVYMTDTYGEIMYVFWGVYFTGVLALSSLPYLWSYQADYFDLVRSLPLQSTEFLDKMFKLGVVLCLITGIPSFLYYFLYPESIYIHSACLIFNIGFNVPLMLYAANYNNTKIDISSGGSFNTQGLKASHFIITMIVLFIPMFIYSIFSVWNYDRIGLGIIAGLGVLGLLCYYTFFKKVISDTFIEKRHAMAEGFRK